MESTETTKEETTTTTRILGLQLGPMMGVLIIKATRQIYESPGMRGKGNTTADGAAANAQNLLYRGATINRSTTTKVI